MKLLDLIKQFGQANYNCGFFNQQSGELTKKYEIERQKYFDEIVGQIDLRVSLQNADGWSVRNKVGEPKETDKIEQTEKQVKVESEVKSVTGKQTVNKPVDDTFIYKIVLQDTCIDERKEKRFVLAKTFDDATQLASEMCKGNDFCVIRIKEIGYLDYCTGAIAEYFSRLPV